MWEEGYRPDLILMDIVLKSKMDGIEAAERITFTIRYTGHLSDRLSNQNIIERAKTDEAFRLSGQNRSSRMNLYANIEMALPQTTG